VLAAVNLDGEKRTALSACPTHVTYEAQRAGDGGASVIAHRVPAGIAQDMSATEQPLVCVVEIPKGTREQAVREVQAARARLRRESEQ
jgi:hypothetical protein